MGTSPASAERTPTNWPISGLTEGQVREAFSDYLATYDASA